MNLRASKESSKFTRTEVRAIVSEHVLLEQNRLAHSVRKVATECEWNLLGAKIALLLCLSCENCASCEIVSVPLVVQSSSLSMRCKGDGCTMALHWRRQ